MTNTEWKESTIGDIADVQTGPFGSQLHEKDYVSAGTPIVTVEHLGNRIFSTQNLPMVSDSDKSRLQKYCMQHGDLIFSRVGSVDRCTYANKNNEGWLFSGRCLRVRPQECVDSMWLYYFFCLESTKTFIRNIAVGATMPSINTKLMCEVPVKYPPLAEQQRIAKILSSLDDKIELNNAINRNLEKQVKTLYIKLFVKERNGKDGLLGDLISIKYGKDHKKLADGQYPVYGSGGIMRYVDQFLYDQESVLIPRKGSLNNVMYVNEPFWSVDTMFYTEMKRPNIAKYIFIFLSNQNLESLNAGSAVPSMTTDILNAMKILIPDNDVLSEFENFAAPIYRKITDNARENKELALIRDSLLPRLMSGDLGC